MKIQKTHFDSQTIRYNLIRKRKSIGVINVKNAFISDLEIDQEYRRKGLATKLMQAVIRDFEHEDLSLETEVDECISGISLTNLRKFYRKFGFVSHREWHDLMVRKGSTNESFA